MTKHHHRHYHHQYRHHQLKTNRLVTSSVTNTNNHKWWNSWWKTKNHSREGKENLLLK